MIQLLWFLVGFLMAIGVGIVRPQWHPVKQFAVSLALTWLLILIVGVHHG